MKKLDPTVKRETVYILICTTLCSALMQAVFLIIGEWDYTVLLGNVLGLITAVANFLLMGITVQRAVNEEPKQAACRIRASQSYRLIFQGVVLVLAAVLDAINLWAVALPLLFPRVGVQLRPLFDKMMSRG